MSELVKRRTKQQAQARERRILEGIAEIGPFLQDEDWRILGYEELEHWVREKLTPVLRELDASLGTEIRNPIILQIDADQQAKPSAQRLRQREIGELAGVSHTEVQRVLSRSSTGTDVPTDDLDTTSDQDVVDAEIVDDRPRNLSDDVRKWREQFPARAELKSTPEDAAKWIPEFIESINADLDNITDWQELSSPETKELLREELSILRDKIARIEEKL